uniref:SCP domain-containing protein n=1 Tax=Mesocestoides corti TaxID=53468 RepID=A0A5K3F441_MESCO
MRVVIYFMVLIWSAVTEIPTDEQRREIVELHTKLRESVQPPASNMMLMRYSSELEALAQKYIANCSSGWPNPWTLPEDIFDLGRLSSSSTNPYASMLTKFSSQRQYYNYDQYQCKDTCFEYQRVR